MWADAVRLPPIRHATLPNGLRIALMEYHRAPVLEMVAVVDGGASCDPPGKGGTASLVAALLRRGTTTRSATALAEQIDFLGGSLDATADPDAIRISVSGLARDTGAWLDLLADVMRHPTFPAAELERERKLRIDALDALVADPGALAEREATRLVYAGYPYGMLATATSLRAISRGDVTDYYRERFTPAHVAIVAVGDFSTATMLKELRSRFADWPAAVSALPKLPPLSPERPRILLVDKPDIEQAHLRFVRPGITRADPQLTAARVVSTVLGGGFTSRLVQQVRVRRSLTYDVWSAVRPLRSTGEVEIGTFTKVATTRRTADVVEQVTGDMARRGIEPAELRKVQNYLSGLFAIEAQTPSALASRLADDALYRLPDTELTGYIARVRAVTVAQADRAAHDLFDSRAMSLVIVGPASKIRGQLKGLGPVQAISAEDVVR